MRWIRAITVVIANMLQSVLAYLWSGWGALASVFLFFAAWEWAGQLYGDLLLPGPLATLKQLQHMLIQGSVQPVLWISARRTGAGLVLAMAVGSVLGFLAGRWMTAALMARPLITLLLGIPPIAWLVLALLWFGMGDATPVFTVFVACVPIVFVGAMQGMRTLDHQLRDVAKVLRLPWWMRLSDVYIPHMLSYLFPAWITALGTSWKVVVMAELLGSAEGVGAQLAISRAQLDSATSLAWIAAVLLLLLAVEYLLLEPIKRHTERWRQV